MTRDTSFIPLGAAVYCESCQGFCADRTRCPRCDSGAHLMAIQPVWDRRTEGAETQTSTQQ